MVEYVVTLTAVLAGFFLGGMWGGNLGSFAGGLGALFLCLVVKDVLFLERTLEGFFARHRTEIAGFVVVVILVILGSYLLGPTWGTLLGLVGGRTAGEWIAGRLGWSAEQAQNDLLMRALQLTYPVALVGLDSPPDPRELKTLHKIARCSLQPLGLHHERDVQNVLEISRRLIDEPAYINWLPTADEELRFRIVWNCLEVIYSRESIPSEKRQFVVELEQFLNLQNLSVLGVYDRSIAIQQMRIPALNVLGLAADATESQIDATYRDAVRQFHPDRVQGVPDHLSALAREKMVQINEAYHLLKTSDPVSLKYTFRGVEEDAVIAPDGESSFLCRCWLCRKANRIPDHVVLHSLRCGDCHALLGQPVPPT